MQGDIFHADYYFNLCHKKAEEKSTFPDIVVLQKSNH